MRKAGYYWVRYIQPFFEGDIEYGEWKVAEWNGIYWSLPGEVAIFYDEEFEGIDENLLKRPFEKVIFVNKKFEAFDEEMNPLGKFISELVDLKTIIKKI